MNIVLVGAGNLATNLAHALLKSGHQISTVFSRTIQSAMQLATIVGASPVDNIDNLPSGADIYIVAVKDDVIEKVTTAISFRFPEALIVHTAGTVSIDNVKSTRRGVFYPMQTFSKERIVDFRNIPIFIEAVFEKDVELLTDLANSLSNNVMILDGDKRKILHLAAVFCCNFSNHCSAIAEFILNHYNIPFNVMLPLINETTNKLQHCSPKSAQTGPAVRNDKSVMDAHLDILRNNGLDNFYDIYKLMSLSIQRFDANDVSVE